MREKILHDIIDTTIYLMLQKKIMPTGISMTELFGKCQSRMCRNSRGQIHVETPNKQVKQYYKYLDIRVPAHIRMDSFMKDIICSFLETMKASKGREQ